MDPFRLLAENLIAAGAAPDGHIVTDRRIHPDWLELAL